MFACNQRPSAPLALIISFASALISAPIAAQDGGATELPTEPAAEATSDAPPEADPDARAPNVAEVAAGREGGGDAAAVARVALAEEAAAAAQEEEASLSDAELLRRNGRHCAGGYKERWVMSQLFAIQTNPEGAMNSLRLGACFPLIRTPGVLYDYTSVEIGILNDLSPAFVHLGGYAQITPLSVLQLRVESSGFVYWPLGLPRAGYYPRNGYDDGFQPDDLPGEDGTSMTGWNMNFLATLRGKVQFNSVWGMLLLSMLSVSYWDIADNSYYFNLRWDVILRDQDWLIANELFLGLETRVTDAFAFRYGFFDSYRHVPNADYSGHQLGLFVMGWWPKPRPAMWDFQPFVRAGVYLDHDFREESFSVLAGIITQYQLGDI